jgi:AcrR family transcriptional regulator
MSRDPQATRQRLLEAAADEFAAYGIAGARVERIAAAARSNKSQIYHHFGSKKRLFDAVLDALVTRTADQVPFDARDLPGYAARLVDLYEDDPRIARLATWHRLEHSAPAGRIAMLAAALLDESEQIRLAQAVGVLPPAREPPDLLNLVLHLSFLWTLVFPQLSDQTPGSSRDHKRRVVAEAVCALLGSPPGAPASHFPKVTDYGG